jgi:hypothetical protein
MKKTQFCEIVKACQEGKIITREGIKYKGYKTQGENNDCSRFEIVDIDKEFPAFYVGEYQYITGECSPLESTKCIGLRGDKIEIGMNLAKDVREFKKVKFNSSDRYPAYLAIFKHHTSKVTTEECPEKCVFMPEYQLTDKCCGYETGEI